jgi:DNA polymerase-3 subunit alpha
MTMFDLLKTSFRGRVKANDLNNYIGQTVKLLGLFVCDKTVRTKNNKKMWFGTFIDDEGSFFDTVHFPNTTPIYPFRGAGCYLMEGKVLEDFGFASLEVRKFAKMEIVGNPVVEV